MKNIIYAKIDFMQIEKSTMEGAGAVFIAAKSWYLVERLYIDGRLVWKIFQYGNDNLQSLQAYADELIAGSSQDRDLKVISGKEVFDLYQHGELQGYTNHFIIIKQIEL
jgi:threonine dehydratase